MSRVCNRCVEPLTEDTTRCPGCGDLLPPAVKMVVSGGQVGANRESRGLAGAKVIGERCG